MKPLPVDPGRLRRQFPELSEEDLDAYATITRRLLRSPASRGRALREVMQLAAAARDKQAAGAGLSRDEALCLRYRLAVEKMQRPATARS